MRPPGTGACLQAYPPGATAGQPGNVVGVGHVPGWLRPPGMQDPDAFSPGRGGKPAAKRGPITDLLQLFEQAQPDALAHVLSVGPVQPVASEDSPDQRRVPVHQRVLRLPVAVAGAGDQVNDHLGITPWLVLTGETGIRRHCHLPVLLDRLLRHLPTRFPARTRAGRGRPTLLPGTAGQDKPPTIREAGRSAGCPGRIRTVLRNSGETWAAILDEVEQTVSQHAGPGGAAPARAAPSPRRPGGYRRGISGDPWAVLASGSGPAIRAWLGGSC
jgi:hypothetical protein